MNSKATVFARSLPKRWRLISSVLCILCFSALVEPIWVDLNGGMDRLPDLADITTRIRSKVNKKADLRHAIARDNSADFKIINGVAAERLFQTVNVLPRANFRFEFLSFEATSSLQDLAHLQGLIDLDQVVVITGFAEVGPWKLTYEMGNGSSKGVYN
jgi:fatty acid synthase subunit alpha, fungi type